MFYFYHSDQEPKNAPYHKGVLFEELLAEFLSGSGYKVDEIRRKSRSLEYDIVAHHQLDGRRVIGEAKAHEAHVGAQEVSAFVGKYAPFYYRDKKVVGLFLSTSPLSPESQDYLRSVIEESPFDIHRHCGLELEDAIRDRLGFPKREILASAAGEGVPVVLGQHLLYTDAGAFVVLVGAGMEGGYPDRFLLLRPPSTQVGDPTFLSDIRDAIAPFQDLEPLASSAPKRLAGRPVSPGIAAATSWTDYRHPAGSAFFVGRDGALSRLRALLEGSATPGLVELKARSGVGKSSTLLVLQEQLESSGHRVWMHDARDIRSAADVFTVLAESIGSSVSSFEELTDGLADLSDDLDRGQRAILIVDQFESALQSPEVFAAYEYLARSVTSLEGLGLLVARKDDLLTTHDELQVDFNRLRNLATAVSLDDLDRDEAVDLLQAAAEAVGPTLGSQVLAQILEFAQGFPWLLKRTLAHVVDSLEGGASAQELESGGLHLNELFQEEISGLDEVERGYLTRLATVLPATHRAIMQRFDDDPALPGVLDRLTQRRILRHSAGTYDTYNDVFKDYLLFQRLPERAYSYLFRQRPGPVLEAFRLLRSKTNWDIDEVQATLGRPIGSAYNILRELRVLGLLQKKDNKWVIPQAARDYEHRTRLGEFIRQSVLKNQAVVAVLNALEEEPLLPSDLADLLEDHFAFVEASRDAWRRYTTDFISWLSTLALAAEKSDGRVALDSRSRESVVADLGNLNVPVRGSRPSDAPFVPSGGWAGIRRLIGTKDGTSWSKLSTTDQILVRELEPFRVVERRKDRVVPLVGMDDFARIMRGLFKAEPYSVFWKELRRQEAYLEAFREAFGFEGLTDLTCITLAKKLANWGRELEILSKNSRFAERASG